MPAVSGVDTAGVSTGTTLWNAVMAHFYSGTGTIKSFGIQ
jgi:hypothetical protein